ncbi:MAG: hypothetical protein AB2604_10750 [Candidatus Thiodiazotropha taylori]
MISEQTGILLTVISTREALQLAESQSPGYPNLVDKWKETLSQTELELLEVYDNAVLRALEDTLEQCRQNQH